jgi:hypothetical protein
MDTEEKCDIENPCDNICDLDIGRCFPTVEEPLPPGLIQTKIEGRAFVGYLSTIMKVIAPYYGKLKEVTCSTGLDVILYEEFNNKIFTTLQDDYSDLISFIDVGSGKILCSIKSQLMQYWKAKLEVDPYDRQRGSYRGFEAQPGDNIVSKKEQIMAGERKHTLYLNFDMWPTKFITESQAKKVIDSQDNLFLLIPIQYRYYDTNPTIRVGAHHNWDRKTDTGGDSLYLVAGIKTIGKELVEVEDPMEIIGELMSDPDIDIDLEEGSVIVTGWIRELILIFPFMTDDEQQAIRDEEIEGESTMIALIFDPNAVSVTSEDFDLRSTRNYSDLPDIWRNIYEASLEFARREEG